MRDTFRLETLGSAFKLNKVENANARFDKSDEKSNVRFRLIIEVLKKWC